MDRLTDLERAAGINHVGMVVFSVYDPRFPADMPRKRPELWPEIPVVPTSRHPSNDWEPPPKEREAR